MAMSTPLPAAASRPDGTDTASTSPPKEWPVDTVRSISPSWEKLWTRLLSGSGSDAQSVMTNAVDADLEADRIAAASSPTWLCNRQTMTVRPASDGSGSPLRCSLAVLLSSHASMFICSLR